MLLSWKYLQVPPTPFLPPIKSEYRYTIVLDLDETIIYYNQDSKILKFRPFLDTFLKKLESMKF
jgi:predicted HAD superfamily phosphohydrolase YqeG